MRIAKNKQMQGLIRLYRSETGEAEIDMHEVAKWALGKGWPLPKPINPLDRLAALFSDAAREETRYDQKTGLPYRANHAFPYKQGDQGQQLYLWIDIDEAPRTPMLKSLVNRREQIVGDVLQLTLDAEHWNNIHPVEQPIVIQQDFTDDVEWRRNSADDTTA